MKHSQAGKNCLNPGYLGTRFLRADAFRFPSGRIPDLSWSCLDLRFTHWKGVEIARC